MKEYNVATPDKAFELHRRMMGRLAARLKKVDWRFGPNNKEPDHEK